MTTAEVVGLRSIMRLKGAAGSEYSVGADLCKGAFRPALPAYRLNSFNSQKAHAAAMRSISGAYEKHPGLL